MTYSHKKSETQILVIGAGELGMAVLRAFSRKTKLYPQNKISVLLRDDAAQGSSSRQEKRLDALRKLDISIVKGDLEKQSVEQLSALFSAFDAVINCSGFVGGSGTQLKITQAVLSAGVARYFPWQFGVDYAVVGKGSGQEVWDEQLEVRHRLRDQKDTAWVIVSTGIFTSYLFEPGFGVVDDPGKTVYGLGDWDNAVTLTTPEDIGTLTAEIFFHQPLFRDEIIYIAGDTLTYRELADLMQAHWGENIQRKLLNNEKLRNDVQNYPDDIAAKYRLAFARSDGVAWSKAETFNARRGIATTTAAQWLESRQDR